MGGASEQSGRQASGELSPKPPSSGARPRHLSIARPDEGSLVDLSNVLHGEEVVRARVFFRVVMLLSVTTAGFLPFLGGQPQLRIAAAALCVFIALACGAVLYVLTDRSRYTPGLVTAIAAVFSVTGVVIIHYVGIFSAGAMVLCLGVYFFGMSHSRLAARVSYGTVALLYLVSSAGLAAGVLEDHALFSTAHAHPFTRWFQVVMSQVIFALTFYLARRSRRALEGAVDRVKRAAVQIQKRDALIQEARADLARATSPTDGRYTGEDLGGHQIGAILGRGAMGEVYDATDPRGRRVAVKLLHANLVENPDQVKRFLREAEAASAVKSPHVPRVHATGWTDEGAPYLVMELLEGHDLAWHLRRRGTLEIDLIVQMCDQVAEALERVREAGIVHRDLKPANLLLTDSIPRTWKVLDFGLSKILWQGSMTRNVAVGTPSYMAPEQIKGPKVDHLTDQYALAAIAYRAITGRPPFSGEQVAHILFRVVHEQPPSPAMLAKMPVDVELVLAIGMAKKREDRFGSATELAEAMRDAAKGRLSDTLRRRGWALLKERPWGSSDKPRSKEQVVDPRATIQA